MSEKENPALESEGDGLVDVEAEQVELAEKRKRWAEENKKLAEARQDIFDEIGLGNIRVRSAQAGLRQGEVLNVAIDGREAQIKLNNGATSLKDKALFLEYFYNWSRNQGEAFHVDIKIDQQTEEAMKKLKVRVDLNRYFLFYRDSKGNEIKEDLIGKNGENKEIIFSIDPKDPQQVLIELTERSGRTVFYGIKGGQFVTL